MSQFNLKSLTFYGGAIAAVVVLFEVVTAYGENNLKAPINIDGRYRLSYTQQPDCLNSNAPILTIQQSGIYLNGSLLPAQTNAEPTSAEKKTTLTGQISNQQLSLVGTVPTSTVCNNISQAEVSNRPKDNSPSSITIQSRLQGEKTLEGQMTISDMPKVIGFTAQREAPAQPSKSSH